MPAPSLRQPVGIVGLGLIGGSLGLDLQARGVEVRGLVRRQATALRARERALATEVGTDPALLRECGLVVLALPLDRLLDPDPAFLEALPLNAVLTDVGSVKGPVLECWRQRLTSAGRAAQVPLFVPGHPMAGTASAGVEAGEYGLFAGRPWVATPGEGTDPGALQAVRELAEAVGACWLTCPPGQHDQAAALISHLPVLVGAALLATADRGSGERGVGDLARFLASSGFADTTRVGGGPPELGTLMARLNQQALLGSLATYREELAALEALVAAGRWPELAQRLGRAQTLRPAFLAIDPAGGSAVADDSSPGEA
ncbi:MAG: prephenate/arogenate dehydrogenase [Cyanobium sp.]